jgi:hypothetical protein
MRYLLLVLMMLAAVSVSLAQEVPTNYCVAIWDTVPPYASEVEEFEDQYFVSLEEAETWLAENDLTLPPVTDIGYNRPAGAYLILLQDQGAGLPSPTLQELYVVHSLLQGIDDVYVYVYYPVDSPELGGNNFTLNFGDAC